MTKRIGVGSVTLLLACGLVACEGGFEEIGSLNQPVEVTWTDAVGVTATGNSLEKTAAAGWNAGAISTQSINGGAGYVEFTTAEDTTRKMIGLSNGNSNQDYTDIDFGIYLRTSPIGIEVFEQGLYRGSFGSYVPGDIFRVEVQDNDVMYLRNGAVFYTSERPPRYPLVVDTSLFDPGATIQNAFIEDAFWIEAVNVTVDGNDMVKSGLVDDWNAGAISSGKIPAGSDGFVQFTTAESTTRKMVGLSNGNTSQHFNDIDFAMFLRTSPANVVIYESGANRGSFGGYSAADTFRVQVTDGVVEYLRNGVVLYTSAVAPTFPLIVDTSLATPGATVQNILLSVEDFWQNDVGVAIAGRDLLKTAANGWDAGASSVDTIDAGDGFAEFSTREITTRKMVGLGTGDASQHFSDIEYAIYMRTSPAQIEIYESGVFRGRFGAYAPGDTFRVEVNGGVVRYLHNGGLVFTSPIAPTYPLRIDSSVFSTNATVTDARIVDQ